MISLSSQLTPAPLSAGLHAARKPFGGQGGARLAWSALAAALTVALPSSAQAAVTTAITSPPPNISVVAGTPLPLAGSVIETDDTLTVVQVQFVFNGQRLLQFATTGPFVRTITAPPNPGTYPLIFNVDESDGTRTTLTQSVTVVAADSADPTPSTTLLTALGGRTVQAGAAIMLTATAESLRPDGGLLAQIDFYADSTLIGSFDGSGTAITPDAAAAAPRRPFHTNDVSDNGPAANGTVFRAPWTVPAVDKLVNLTTVATTTVGRSQISTVVPVRVITDTTDTPPVVKIDNVTDGEQFPVNTALNVPVSASDPDSSGTVTGPGTVIAQVSNYINLTLLNTALTPPYGFPYALNAAGIYVINSIATDGAGLSTVADPIIIKVVAPTVLTFAKPADNHVLEGAGPKRIRLVRTGDLSEPLTVAYRTAGDAVSGEDYLPLSGTATFEAGVSRVKIRVRAPADGVVDLNKTLKLILVQDPNGAYTVGTPARVNLRIINVD